MLKIIFFFFTESIQLVTTPTNRPKSVIMNNKRSQWDEFLTNIHNMSHLRFSTFVLSILLCFAVIVVVLLIIPCEWSNCISETKIKLLWSESIFTDIGIIIYYYYISNNFFNTSCVYNRAKRQAKYD